MVQSSDSTEGASPQSTRPDSGNFIRPFVPRKGTQRHCDHLEKLQAVACNPRERKIESTDVSDLLETLSSTDSIYGYWEVNGQLFEEPTWATIVCCDTFEVVVQCPPGKRITLGNLDLAVILLSCLEHANGDAFVRKVSSTSKCWPTGHVDFRWLLRGTLAEDGPGPDLKGDSPPFAQPPKPANRLFSPIKQLKLATQSLEKKRTLSIDQLRSPTSPTNPSLLQRWDSARRQSLDPSGGICASPTTQSHEKRRSSTWKERTSSLFQSKRQSHHSTSSKSSTSHSTSSSSSSESRSTVIGGSEVMWNQPFMPSQAFSKI
ncbi:hypothetical protein KVR01_004325 [Diaporthe batatas]|uniref:uncharacterized protein n=1 Tax=Diaporthe batatas TaxID=748121 RepID=UPI001D05AE22|nr:uncharacterized protein KVR01_004325 [Diaporthe batatas]KAG8165773.1 hypothetical protein KVR01_004325 [Diaporthe batatas]